jgi:hypothetical protein
MTEVANLVTNTSLVGGYGAVHSSQGPSKQVSSGLAWGEFVEKAGQLNLR